jgi:hypothetical protein
MLLPYNQPGMPIDIDQVFTRGGTDLVELLNYCVRSVQMDPIFGFLVDEYRLCPTAPKAVALYDVFLAPRAPARINAAALLPPRDQSLQVLIQNFRTGIASPLTPKLNIQPGKFIFDTLALHIRTNRRGSIAKIKRRYNPQRSATENLPGGKMTIGQRRFVEQVWQPRVRPLLVRAGFRRIANIA